jgi:hypothetical protein
MRYLALISLILIMLVGCASQRYRAGFVDHFQSNALDPAWAWYPSFSTYSLTAEQGYFTLEVSSSEDTWKRSTSFVSPHLHMPAPRGSWTMTTFMKGYPGARAQCGLLFLQDVDHWLCWGYVFDRGEADSHLRPGVGLEGLVSHAGKEELFFAAVGRERWRRGVHLQVRFDADADQYQFYYSLDANEPWIYQGAVSLKWKDVRVGLWGKSWGDNPGYAVGFDFLQVRCSAVAFETPADDWNLF